MQYEIQIEWDTINIAIDLVARETAKTSGRHPEWIKRRLREACRWMEGKGPEHPDWHIWSPLFQPVWYVAAQIDGRVDATEVHLH